MLRERKREVTMVAKFKPLSFFAAAEMREALPFGRVESRGLRNPRETLSSGLGK
jgi:hypothetical protein